MTARAELYQLVDQLDDVDVPVALDYLRALTSPAQTSAGTDRAEEPEHDPSNGGEYAKLGRPTDANDSLWNIVGIGRTEAPTNIRNHKDDDLADAYAPETRGQ